MARELLAVRLDTIGDVLMSGPALRGMRSSPPGRRLTLLTSPSGAEVARLMPEVDEVIVYDAPWMKATAPRGPEADLAMVEQLRARGFEAAVIFTVYSQSALPAALLCHLAGVPLRLAHSREKAYQLLTDRLPEREPDELVRHEVRRQLDLVAAVGARTDDERLRLAVPDAAREHATELLDEAGVDRGGVWLVVHPGGTAPSRRYPAEGWADACRRLHDDHGVQVVFTGDAEERGLVESIRAAAGTPGPSLAGRLALAELPAVLEAAPLLASGNTGPLHLAAAAATPVVDPYALTNPQHTPWRVPAPVLYPDGPCPA